MSVEDRLEALERRVKQLEAQAPSGPPPMRPPSPPTGPRPASTARALYNAARKPMNAPRLDTLSTEQWFGQRGVLAAGVLLVLLAGAYFLKIAIDRGWISPTARCIAAIVGGHAIAAVGWRSYHSGTKTFGASLIGVGAGIVYLGIWAAASWYALVSPPWGIVGLALVAIATSVVAYRLEIEVLATAAAVGALAGPIVIAAPDASANALLIYLTGVAVTLGAAAVRRQWQTTTLLIVLMSVLLALPATEHAAAMLASAYAVMGGTAALVLRRRWTPIGLIGFLGAWRMLLLVAAPAGEAWIIVAGGLLLAAPICWDALRTHRIWPDGTVLAAAERWSFGESLFFYLTPLMLWGSAAAAFPEWATLHPGALSLLLALPYLVVGYLRIGALRRSRSPFALVGTTAAVFAALYWPGHDVGTVVALLGMALLWAGLDHLQQRSDSRWYALLALGGASIGFNAILRDSDGAAFVDSWALTLWLSIGVLVVLALGLWKVTGSEAGAAAAAARVPGHHAASNQDGFFELGRTLPPLVVPLLWVGAGVLLFFGVTNELSRLIGLSQLAFDVIPLVKGLAVSAWWAVCAGALVVFGFYRRLAPVRIAGLFVAGLAVIKVLFFDLANLDQLYRVGSFVILGGVLLGVAYLYHRQAAMSDGR